MASFIGSDQELLCPICAGPYSAPRKLPGCVHSFCETCILTFLQNLKKDDKLGENFDCPVCRLPSKSPEEDSITTDWLHSLEKDKPLHEKLGKEQEYDSRWCSQCRYVNKFIKSKVYCTTCQESFCESCSETLHSFKMNRKHALIDVRTDDDVNKHIHEQAVDLIQKFLSCPDHPEKSVEFFCQDEEKFCCAKCATSCHQQCKNLNTVQELQDSDNLKSDEAESSVLVDLSSKLMNHIQTITDLINEKDAESRKTPEKLAAEFQSIKEKVIRLLDAAEECIMQDSKAHAKAVSMMHSDKIQQLGDIAAEVKVVAYILKNLIVKLPSHSVMVCYKKAKLMLHSLERIIVEQGSGFETKKMLLKTENVLDTIINLGPNETKGIVSVQINPEVCPVPRLDDEKFPLVQGKIKLIDEKNCIAEESPGNYPKYNSITFLPDNKVILTDSYYGVCLLADTNLITVNSIDFQVAEVNENSNINANFIYSSYLANGLIAVSFTFKNKICFLSAGNQLEVKGEILCKYAPTAIQGLRNGDICVLWNNPAAFGIISQCGGSYREKVYLKKDTEGRSLRHMNRLVVDEDRLQMVLSTKKSSSTTETAIIAYDFEGNRVFKYCHQELKDPRGMTSDSDGNIYICENSFSRIYVLSPEGLLVRTIQEGCPKLPLGIGFNKTANTFAVSQAASNSKSLVFFSIQPP